jgi:hypothetical protein
MDHNGYIKKTRTMSEASLRYVIKDCQLALEAMPNSGKAGHYADEISYCAMELNRRA